MKGLMMRKDAANTCTRLERVALDSSTKILITLLVVATCASSADAAQTKEDSNSAPDIPAIFESDFGPMKMPRLLPEITSDDFALGWVRPDRLIDRPAFSEFGAGTFEALPDRNPAALWEAEISGTKAWTDVATRAVATLGPHLMQASITAIDFCPAFERLTQPQKQSFWVRLISAMSFRESAWNPAATYREAWSDPASGQRAVSRGLLQLSKGSTDAYGCGFRSDQDVHDPGRNLACGVRILDWWIQRDGRITGGRSGAWRGAARYWAVLRTSKTLSWIRETTRALPMCQ